MLFKILKRCIEKGNYETKEAMQEKLGKYLALAIEYVDEIEKAPNGKFRYIISKL